MRILVGHTNQIPQIRDGSPLPIRQDCADEILAFGNGYEQVAHTPGMPWQELLDNCPSGWRPDVYIHWSPEYNAVPQGLEQADCLTVGVFGDWNLAGHAIRSIAGVFDVLVADRAGGEMLRNAGYENLLYARLWAYDPDLHCRLDSPTRDIDILMIGNFNHAIHAGRSRLLARVARLSTRYHVVFTRGIHGAEYTRMMNRARIVFNHSVGGGINMRAYEAPACGALLFNEAIGSEIQDIYTDRVDCVLYDDDNLEALLDYYLDPAHAAAYEAIAQAGWERVQPHTYARHFADLLTQLEPLVARFQQGPTAAKAKRSFGRPSQHEQVLNLAAHWVRTSEPSIYFKIEPLLKAAEQDKTPCERAELAGLCAVLQGKWAELSPSPARKSIFADAIAQAQHAITLEPDYVMGRCNLAYLYLAVQQVGTGERLLRQALRLLEAPDLRADQLRGDHFPQGYSYFHMESERIWGRYAPGSSEWRDALRKALGCHIRMTLAEIAYARQDFGTAMQEAQAAIVADPKVAQAHYGLGNVYQALGQRQSAAEAYCRAIGLSPFLLEAWRNLAQVYLDLNRPTEARDLMEDLATILDGCPVYNPVRAEYDRLRVIARDRAANEGSSITSSITSLITSPITSLITSPITVEGSPITVEPSPPSPLRLLALPDWNDTDSWQPLLRDYVGRYAPVDPITLLLPVDPERHPNVELVVTDITRFLETCLHTTLEAIPDVVLLTEPQDSARHWTRLPQADALVLLQGTAPTIGDTPPTLRTLTLAQLGQAHDILRSKT